MSGLPTFDEVDEELLFLLNQPDSQEPSREVRLHWFLAIIDTLIKETNRTNKPHFIDSFPLQVQPSQAEYSIPVDDFAGLYYVKSTVTGREHEIDPVNFVDANLARVDFHNRSLTAEASAVRVSVVGQGDDVRLRFYPMDSLDTVLVYYHKSLDRQVDGADFIPVLDDFHWVLVPAAVGLFGMDFWSWPRFSEEKQEMLRARLRDVNLPWSFANVAERQRQLFLEHAFNPTVQHATTNLQGHGTVRRRLRRRVIR